MRSIFLLAIIYPALLFAAPVAIETSGIDRENSNNRFGIGYTVSNAQRPFVAVDNQSTSLPYISYRSHNFYIEGLNIGYQIKRDERVKLDLLASPRFYEVKASFADGDELADIDETKPTVFGGLSVRIDLDSSNLNLQLLRDLAESDGIEAVASFSRNYSITDNLTLIPAIGLTWQDSALVDHFYGVQENEVIPGRNLYRAKSTINYNISLTTSWNITNNIELLGFIKYESLGDEIQDSPIVDETAIVLSAIGLVYRF